MNLKSNLTFPQFYILQLYSNDKTDNIRKNDSNCVNVFYCDESGKDKIWLGYPEKATRYKTIGEAMKVSARLSTENKGVYFKAIPIYNENVLTRKNKDVKEKLT